MLVLRLLIGMSLPRDDTVCCSVCVVSLVVLIVVSLPRDDLGWISEIRDAELEHLRLGTRTQIRR